jgi:hypothetical protein
MASTPLVVCIKVGTKYGPDYVNKLSSMLLRHTKHAFDMVCLTDDAFGVRIPTKPIDTDLPGWWAKLILFKPHPATFGRNVLYLDLDTVIVANVDVLLKYRPGFIILKDWWANTYNSSVMRIPRNYGRKVYHAFMKDPARFMAHHSGDQDWISLQVQRPNVWQSVTPGLIGSYKAHDLADDPKDYSIICFHGEPKPHEFKDGWVYANWR